MASLTINLEEVIIAYCSLELMREHQLQFKQLRHGRCYDGCFALSTFKLWNFLVAIICQLCIVIPPRQHPPVHQHCRTKGTWFACFWREFMVYTCPSSLQYIYMWIYMMINDVHVYIYAQIYEGTSEDNLAHVDASIHNHSHIVYVYYDIRQDIFFQNFHNPSMEDMLTSLLQILLCNVFAVKDAAWMAPRPMSALGEPSCQTGRQGWKYWLKVDGVDVIWSL